MSAGKNFKRVRTMNGIKITIKFFALLKEKLGESESTILLPKGADVDKALKELMAQHPELAKMIDCSFVALNEEYALQYAILKEGDTLAIIPPVSGG